MEFEHIEPIVARVMADVDSQRHLSLVRPAPMAHYYQNVAGFFWFEEAYRRMLKTLPLDRPSVFVEVGSYQGQSAAFLGVELINRRIPCTLHCIDPWERPNDQTNGDEIRAAFERNVLPVASVLGDRFRFHAVPSVDAATLFTDAAVDVVWLDGDHSFDGVLSDIDAWWPKLKPGGFMGGDDFMMTPVCQAVCERFAPDYILCHGWTTNPQPMCWPSWIVRKA
jgi:hypothetical protein